MTWLAIRLFMGKALERLLSAFKWALGHPWQALSIALALWVAYERFDAIRGWQSARDWKASHDRVIEASNANRAEAERQAHEQQAKLDASTKDAKNDHKAIGKDADSRLVVYRNRMRLDKGCIGPTPAAAEGNNPSVPADVLPDSSMVAIRSDELQNLIDWFKVGLAAHNENVAKVNSGAAMPDPAFGH
jgi:hypothetical protein